MIKDKGTRKLSILIYYGTHYVNNYQSENFHSNYQDFNQES